MPHLPVPGAAAPVDAGRTTSTGGSVAALVASTFFGALFLLPPALEPLVGAEVLGWRILLTIPVVVGVHLATGGWRDVHRVVCRLRHRRALIAILIVDAALLGVQLWLFSWAPQSGNGLDTALGYLLLPLVMVIVGTVLHREQLSLLRTAAVTSAAVGVVAAVVVAGGLSWVTLVVGLGYP